MVIKKSIIPLKPKKSKIVLSPKDRIISPSKFKTKQIDIKQSIRSRKHKRTVRKK